MLYFCILIIAVIAIKYIFPKNPHVLNVYFGVPGAGKTTLAAYLTKKTLHDSIPIRLAKRYPCAFSDWLLSTDLFKRAEPVFSNVPITGALQLNAKEDFGKYMIQNGKVIIDEAGIEFNNRDYKNFAKDSVYFFKYHRHYKTSIDVFSQSYEDMDVTIRRLAQNFYVVKKSFIPYFITVRHIRRKVGIDDNTHQIIDYYGFDFPIIGTKRIFSPVLWRLFNSYSHKVLPDKAWEEW